MLWTMEVEKPEGPLRYGWTTGTCAAAAAKAAYAALLTGEFPDPVTVRLPRGETPAFALAVQKLEPGAATAGIVKDAGDDPDVTHGALILVTVRPGEPGSGVVFRAGEGVGMVTKPGLPVPPGEPAINPVPRVMIRNTVAEIATAHGGSGDVEVTIAIPGGEKLAERTVSGRLGIVGGLSILGPRVSSCRFLVRHGFTRSTAGSMWRGRKVSLTWPAPLAPRPRRRCNVSTTCPRSR
jgi:cobalt-precorrin-5B (C1)-methyltransferase